MLEILEDRNVFGLTGGMGSGKSTVSTVLAERGAAIADADQIVRDLQAPGMPLLADMQSILGADILSTDGSLNRKLAAERTFASDENRLAINALFHPPVWAAINEKIRGAAPEQFVVLDVPLLLDRGKPTGLLGTMVVDVRPYKAVDRLVRFRGFTRHEAELRLSKQMSRNERLSLADFVIDNNSNRTNLNAEIDRAWSWMQRIASVGKRAVEQS